MRRALLAITMMGPVLMIPVAPAAWAQPAAPAPAAPAPAPAVPAPAVLGPTTEAPAIAPAQHDAALAVAEMVGVSHQSDQLITLLRTQIVSLVMRAGNKSPADASKIVDEVIMPDFKASKPELTNDLVDAWARNFSLDDLKALQAFYATPLGQKLIKTLPLVNQQGLQAGQAWGERVYQQSITAHKDDLILRGLKF